MQSVQRSFGKLLNKAPGDNAKVSVLLNDYEDIDKVLAKLNDHTKSWRDSWINLTNTQLGIVSEYEGLYDPIVGSDRTNVKATAPTPELQLNRTFKLKEAYGELKVDLMEEIASIDERVIKPTIDARDCIAPLRKTIKKRENRRLDYEKAQDKAAKIQRKPGKTPKEEAALAKAEGEVAQAAEEFQIADSHLRDTLPPLVNATFSLVPPLLAAIVLINNRLLGLYYTALHGYCEEHNFPSPSPPMEDVIACWSADYSPVKREFESISCIAHGKASKLPMHITPEEQASPDEKGRKMSVPSFRRSPSGLIGSSNNSNAGDEPGPGPMPPRPNRIPSNTSLVSTPGARPPNTNLGIPTEFTTASGYASRSPGASPSSLKPRSDYFSGGQSNRPGTASTVASNISSMSLSQHSNSGGAGPIVKKKPPPPPPKPKRITTGLPEVFVVALYDFAGQGQGDLSFQEGDRIKVVKKTGTDQDWWVGELGGVKGSFPANYCKAV
ncbi:Regulator of cytoskeleton and endocytosis [Apiospora saccharicola]|uniref:Regulator of cytoskeleton and endocytosis n=1 Tax=Apiospora saccharicola TaxID=335842 RepID=A0ABR1VD40_9PEZI